MLKTLKNRPFIAALLFSIGLYALEEILLKFPQGLILRKALIFYDSVTISLIFISAYVSFFLCFLFIWSALISPKAIKVGYMILFTLASMIQYGYWKALQRFILGADLHILAATPLTTMQGAGALYFDWKFLYPSLAFVAVLILFGENQPVKRGLQGALAFVVVMLLANTLYLFWNFDPDLGASLPAFYQEIARFGIDQIRPSQRATVNEIRPQPPANNLVLVIDESIRGDHLSINGYERATTPFLEMIQAQHASIFSNWGVIAAGATCSYPSNALILTGVPPATEEFDLTRQSATLFQYAQAMGYTTYYFDAQTSTFWNGLTNTDIPFLDHWINTKTLGDEITNDFLAADQIAEIVQATGNFIVLNKRGVHFLYENSYPSTEAIWGPIPEDYNAQPELVANAYDNGVRYNVNTFFEHLFAHPETAFQNTTYLYTSDHGQTLFEDHATWLHCNSSQQEATVPLLLIGHPNQTIDIRYQASHSNIFPTLLDLMGFPPEQAPTFLAPSLLSATAEQSAQRFFFNGALQLFEYTPAP